MDPFDTKINKMKQDIDLIKNEIHDIQKVNMIFITINQKNKENKQSLTKSINSLSSTQRNIKHHHQHKPKLNNGDEHRNKNHFNLGPTAPKTKTKINMSAVTSKDKAEQVIEDIVNMLQYQGSLDKLVSYIKVLKYKEELANYVEDNFNNGNSFTDVKTCFKNATKFMKEADDKERECKNEILLYQNLCEELLKKNQDKINSEELKDYFNEIYKVKNMIEKYED